MKRKLFIWRNVFCDYTEGIAFAIAKTKDEAIEVIAKEDYKIKLKQGEYHYYNSPNQKRLQQTFETLEKYLESIKLNNIDHTFESMKSQLSIGDLKIYDINKDYGTYIIGGG